MRGESGQRAPFIPAWVSADGPASDVALSTRARLARNIEGVPFPDRASDGDLRRVTDLVLDALHDSDGLLRHGGRIGKLRVIRPTHLSASADRLALVDARLASRQQVYGGRYRPIVLNDAGTLSLMVNEEDHLRMQCILPGLQPMTALQMVQELDAFLARKIAYARADNYGYLTSSLANVGTGLRLSVMLHLAGLAFLEEAVPVLTAAAELKVSVRGLFGEGTKALGDIFQVSNETTIGFSEKEITSRIRAAAEHLVSREREARRKLGLEMRSELREAAEQARTRLMEARALSGREAMACISVLRLGAELGLGGGLSSRAFKELLASMRLGTCASAKSAAGGQPVGSMADDVKRARLVREKLIEKSQAAQLALPEGAEQ
ncbi:MAG TPA: ATP--guanido phosphotransferase [Armatimonadota bacterium]|nr:ATP--guanido phosphotransferase [Armatimonadota bacterium]